MSEGILKEYSAKPQNQSKNNTSDLIDLIQEMIEYILEAKFLST